MANRPRKLRTVPPIEPPLVVGEAYWLPDPGFPVEVLGITKEGLVHCELNSYWAWRQNPGRRVFEDIHPSWFEGADKLFQN